MSGHTLSSIYSSEYYCVVGTHHVGINIIISCRIIRHSKIGCTVSWLYTFFQGTESHVKLNKPLSVMCVNTVHALHLAECYSTVYSVMSQPIATVVLEFCLLLHADTHFAFLLVKTHVFTVSATMFPLFFFFGSFFTHFPNPGSGGYTHTCVVTTLSVLL
jgi:hypothetical protein